MTGCAAHAPLPKETKRAMDPQSDIEAIKSELEALRSRVAELEAEQSNHERRAAGYHALFHSAPTAMMLMDLDGRFLDVNAAFEAFLGYPLPELRGRSVDDISHPDDIPVEHTLFASMLRGARATVDLEKRYRRKDGTWIWVRVHASPARDAKGNAIGCSAIIREAEETMETAASVRAVEARNRALLDAIPDLLFIMSADARYLDCKPARGVPLFVPPSTFLGRKVIDVLGPALGQRHTELIRSVVETGESALDVYASPDGKAHFEALFSRTSTGEVVVTIRDITTRVEAEIARDRLQEAVHAQIDELRRWKALADRAPDAIALVDLEGVVSYANEAFETLLGRGSLVGLKVSKLLARPEEARDIASALREGGTHRGDLELIRGDGVSFLGQAVLFVMTNQDGASVGFGCIVRDRTDEQRAEEERLKLREELIHTQEKLIRELETPLLPVGRGVLVMPIVGRMDASRADRLLGALLEGISRHSARVVIIDITGMPLVDAGVANTFVAVASAVRLLGAETLLTGVRPGVAQALVEHAEAISVLRPCSTLERAVGIALGKPSAPRSSR